MFFVRQWKRHLRWWRMWCSSKKTSCGRFTQNSPLVVNKVRAPLRGRVFQHMDIFLFNYVPRFRHNESGFSQISIFCGCVKSHGRVWKNESHGVILMVFVGRKPSCWKRQLYAFSSALPTSLFQPLLRQRSPRHLYMSLWQFLRHPNSSINVSST